MRDAYCARSDGAVRAQSSNAPRAASTARDASSAVPRGTLPIISSVVESRTSMSSVRTGTTQAPPMYSLSRISKSPPMGLLRAYLRDIRARW